MLHGFEAADTLAALQSYRRGTVGGKGSGKVGTDPVAEGDGARGATVKGAVAGDDPASGDGVAERVSTGVGLGTWARVSARVRLGGAGAGVATRAVAVGRTGSDAAVEVDCAAAEAATGTSSGTWRAAVLEGTVLGKRMVALTPSARKCS